MEIISQLAENQTLWIAILSWAIAQLIKIVIELIKHKKLDMKLIMSSGGMPSSHSSFVTAMTTSIGLLEGFHTSLFAISAIISMVVMYDAAGVRRAAGKHAEIINTMLDTISDTGVKLEKRLKELLGHTPFEVGAGALLGIFVAIVCIKK